MSVNNLDHRMESTLIKFNDDTKLGISASSLEDRIRNQNDLDKVKKLCKNGEDQIQCQEEQFSQLILFLIEKKVLRKDMGFQDFPYLK